MADKKITELASAGTLDGTESLPLVQGGTTKKSLLSAIKSFVLNATLTALAGLTPGGNALKFVRVNAGANGFELVAGTGSVSALDDLSDVIANYATFNMFFGQGAGASITSASSNLAIGQGSMQSLTSGNQNVAIGYQTLFSVTNGTSSTAIGYQALKNQTGGTSGNTAIGDHALFAVTSGGSNTANGYVAGAGITTGGDNVCIGTSSGGNISTGSQNTCVGSSTSVFDAAAVNRTAVGFGVQALADNSVYIGNASVTDVYFGDGTAKLHGDGSMLSNLPSGGASAIDGLSDAITDYGDFNMFFGTGVGAAASGAGYTTVVGTGAAQAVLTGNYNTGFGALVLASMTSGYQNVAVGAQALQSGILAHENVAIGFQALSSLLNGGANVAIGSGAGASVTGQRNIMIGRGTGVYTPSAVDIIAIGDNVVGGAEKTWVIGGPGMKQAIYEGSNAAAGADTLVGGTVVVSNNLVTANSRIHVTSQDDNGGVPGAVRVSTRTPGVGFTIASTSALDTSVVAWEIKEPN